MCSFTLSVVGSWEADDPAYARPIAAPLQRCAELLGVDLATITAAAGRVQPYVRVDGAKEGPVGEVVRLSGGTVTLQDAVDAFMDHHDLARSTRRVYRASLASLAAGLGPATAVGELSGLRLAGWFRDRHATAAPATWNRELATLRALTRGQLERLFARRDLPLRERTLWRLL
jgi:hypothetical protein